ncbi:hypothetical protein EsHS_00003732 [Epichloe bromicola]
MKFLVTLCFFASAVMALATPPVKEPNDKLSDATASQELGAAQHIVLDKREGSFVRFKIPFGQRWPAVYQTLQATIGFVMIDHWHVTVYLYEVVTQRFMGALPVPAGTTSYLHNMENYAGVEIAAYVQENYSGAEIPAHVKEN